MPIPLHRVRYADVQYNIGRGTPPMPHRWYTGPRQLVPGNEQGPAPAMFDDDRSEPHCIQAVRDRNAAHLPPSPPPRARKSRQLRLIRNDKVLLSRFLLEKPLGLNGYANERGYYYYYYPGMLHEYVIKRWSDVVNLNYMVPFAARSACHVPHTLDVEFRPIRVNIISRISLISFYPCTI